MRIGIVDDHPLFRSGLRQTLSREAGFRVLWEVASASEARRLVEQAPVDLVLMDLNLGGGATDGTTATRMIRRQRPEVRIVMISASAEDHAVLAARQAGAVGYLAKDLRPEEIVSSLRALAAPRAARAAGGSNNLLNRFEAQPAGTAGRRRRTSALGPLSRREAEVLSEIRGGKTNREIARRLHISPTTVNKHVHHILQKLRARNRAQAAILGSALAGDRGRPSRPMASLLTYPLPDPPRKGEGDSTGSQTYPLRDRPRKGEGDSTCSQTYPLPDRPRKGEGDSTKRVTKMVNCDH